MYLGVTYLGVTERLLSISRCFTIEVIFIASCRTEEPKVLHAAFSHSHTGDANRSAESPNRMSYFNHFLLPSICPGRAPPPHLHHSHMADRNLSMSSHNGSIRTVVPKSSPGPHTNGSVDQEPGNQSSRTPEDGSRHSRTWGQNLASVLRYRTRTSSSKNKVNRSSWMFRRNLRSETPGSGAVAGSGVRGGSLMKHLLYL